MKHPPSARNCLPSLINLTALRARLIHLIDEFETQLPFGSLIFSAAASTASTIFP
jgi:hypothetical protein